MPVIDDDADKWVWALAFFRKFISDHQGRNALQQLCTLPQHCQITHDTHEFESERSLTSMFLFSGSVAGMRLLLFYTKSCVEICSLKHFLPFHSFLLFLDNDLSGFMQSLRQQAVHDQLLDSNSLYHFVVQQLEHIPHVNTQIFSSSSRFDVFFRVVVFSVSLHLNLTYQIWIN